MKFYPLDPAGARKRLRLDGYKRVDGLLCECCHGGVEVWYKDQDIVCTLCYLRRKLAEAEAYRNHGG